VAVSGSGEPSSPQPIAGRAAGASGVASGTAAAERASKTLGAAGAAASPGRGSSDGGSRAERTEPVVFPSWNRTLPARAIRRVSLPTWILPLGRAFAWVKVSGLEHLNGVQGPVMFAANHQSHMDAPMILWALPARWRYR